MNGIYKLLALAGGLAVMTFSSCLREEDPGSEPQGGLSQISLQMVQADVLSQPETKSRLTAQDIETRISNLTVFIYDQEGNEAFSAYLLSGFDAIQAVLRSDKTYSIYACANMGDQRSTFISLGASALSEMSYSVDYASINTSGIPMAGRVEERSFYDGEQITIPLERLLAKINVSLTCSWEGAVITGAKVHKLNKLLRPFGVSAATSAADILDVQEIHGTTAGTAASLSAVFYVPENIQGSIEDISCAQEKSYDTSNSSLTAIRDYASYLEVSVHSTGEYEGEMTYRSYLGANASSDFNIRRNEIYNWSILYWPDQLIDYDWKRDNSQLYYYTLSGSMEKGRILLDGSSAADKTDNYTLRLNKYACRDGSLVSSETVTPASLQLYTSASGGEQRSLLQIGTLSTSTPVTATEDSEPGHFFLEATYLLDGTVLTTTERCGFYVNGYKDLFLDEEEVDMYWSQDSQYKYVNVLFNYYEDGTLTSRTNPYYSGIKTSFTEQTSNSSVDAIRESYSSSGLQLRLTSSKGDISEYTDYTIGFTFKPGSYSVRSFTTSCIVHVHPKAEYIYQLEPARATVMAGSTLQLQLKNNRYYAGVQTKTEDYTESATFSLIEGDPDGITLDYNGTKGLLYFSTGITEERVVTVQAACSGFSSGSACAVITILPAGSGLEVTEVEYKDLSVSLDTYPKNTVAAAGGDVFLLYRVLYKYRYVYSDGTSSSWCSGSAQPTITGGASGFTLHASSASNQLTVTVSANTSSSPRSASYTASYSIGGLSDSQSVTITQEGKSKTITDTEYQNLSVYISASPTSLPASGGTATLTYGASYQYRYRYSDGSYGNWISVEATPTVSGNGSGFSRDEHTVTAGENPLATSRSVTYTASYTVGDLSESQSVSITQAAAAEAEDVISYTYRAALSPATATIEIGETQSYTATLYQQKYVNGSPSGSETPVSGASFTYFSGNSFVATLSGNTATGTAGGTTTITASCTYGGNSYTAQATLTVAQGVLELSWESIPGFSCQRGVLAVSGLTGSASLHTPTSSQSTVARAGASPADGKFYIETLSPGTTTLTVTASNGQSGSITLTVTAPHFRFGQDRYYLNPDGGNAGSNTSGLNHDFSWEYYTQASGGSKMSLSTSSGAVTGNELVSSLVSTYIAPGFSLSGTYAACLGGQAADKTVYVARLPSAGKLFDEVQSSWTGKIATLSLQAGCDQAGMSTVSTALYGANPFTSWSSVSCEDEDDYGLISQYVGHSYTQHSVNHAGSILSDEQQQGYTVFLNEEEGSQALRNCFDFSTPSQIRYKLRETALSAHKAGIVSLRGYVCNQHSQEKWYKELAQFKLFVNGAIGAKMSGIGTNTVSISTAFCGDEANYGFGRIGSSKLVSTTYSQGDRFPYIEDTYVTNILADGSSINACVYQLVREDATLNSADQIMEAEKPRFVFLDVSGVGVFNETYYYLQPGGTPTFYHSSLGKNCGYYKLHLLEYIQFKDLGAKSGWIID